MYIAARLVQGLVAAVMQCPAADFSSDAPVVPAPTACGVLDHDDRSIATHGFMANETRRYTDSLAEPSLMLIPPSTASREDDGLLMASEVAQLNLDADWVILSACNTAGGAALYETEALSGLARAFFYAGARSLLVSHWYVDSIAAVKLTTDLMVVH